MKYRYIPQRNDMSQSIKIEGEIITITIDDATEIFDFSSMPEGKMDSIEVEILPLNPIVSAEILNGELKVEILKFHGNLIQHSIFDPKQELYPNTEWQDTLGGVVDA